MLLLIKIIVTTSKSDPIRFNPGQAIQNETTELLGIHARLIVREVLVIKRLLVTVLYWDEVIQTRVPYKVAPRVKSLATPVPQFSTRHRQLRPAGVTAQRFNLGGTKVFQRSVTKNIFFVGPQKNFRV